MAGILPPPELAARPRRSALYVPAANERALGKATSLDADVLIVDLEDSVAPQMKAAARDSAVAFIRKNAGGRHEIALRVNSPVTEWGRDDLAAAIESAPDAILLPKVETVEEVRSCTALLDEARVESRLWLMIESPRAVLGALSLGEASHRVSGLVMGTSDLVKDLRARHTADRSSVLTSLSLCVLAARALGIAALDGVHLDLSDEAGFEAACLQGRDLGFDGKTLIHPRTIAVANRVFSPSSEELLFSRRVIEAHEAAVRDGKGVAVVDGRLVESLHVAEARRLLAIGQRIGAPLPG